MHISTAFQNKLNKNRPHFPLRKCRYIQGVKKKMDPLGIFACFIRVSFQFLEIYGYQQVKPNKTKLFGVP